MRIAAVVLVGALCSLNVNGCGSSGEGEGGDAAVDLGTLDCELPAVGDHGAPGPFDDVEMTEGVGPGGGYTLFRPTASLGRDGAKHPVAVWGNGISTTPDQYQGLLTHVASHGFVVVACNDTMAERPCLNAGMEWLIEQNASGEMAGKLDTSREITFGYSWGGGAAIDTADRPNVVATVSIHGMPPRGEAAFQSMHAPLLLLTTTGDAFVSAEEYVTPNYEASEVQTFYGTLDDPAGHLYPLDDGTVGCNFGPVVTGSMGPCESAGEEQAAVVAWMRLWACGDPQALDEFDGEDCTFCQAPWSAQRKAWD